MGKRHFAYCRFDNCHFAYDGSPTMTFCLLRRQNSDDDDDDHLGSHVRLGGCLGLVR